MQARNFARRLTLCLLGSALLASVTACASGGGAASAAAQQEADRFLYERGMDALQRGRWIQAREYFRTLVDTYPTSEHRQNAKLGIGDSYLGEKQIESDILAASEFREFLRFFPLAPRADYAQYKLAISQVRQVLRPERDQTATREALKELQTFLTNYPSSEHMPEVMKLQREMRDRLSESELLVARYYFRVGHYPGAVSRLEELMKADPSFSRRDALYYYLAESYYRTNRRTDAKPLFQKLVEDFKVSEFLEDAQERVAELAAEPDTPPVANSPAPAAPGSTSAPPATLPPATPVMPPSTTASGPAQPGRPAAR